MSFDTEHPSCDEARERIDDLLDGVAPEAALAAHLDACPACARELALARRLQAALAEGLPPLRCPDEVSEAVLALAERETASAGRRPVADVAGSGRRKTGRYNWLADWFKAPMLRPAMAALVLLLLVVAPVAVWQSLEDDTPTVAEEPTPTAGELDGYTPAEIAAAEEEARRVLAYIASVSRDAGEAVRQEVFEERVVEPVRRLAEETP